MTGLDILAQMLSPTLIIELFCASPGQDSFVQSRIPLRKAELEHKQTTSVVSLHPSEDAFPSMLVIQNCYRWTSVEIIWQELQDYAALTPHGGRLEICDESEAISWARDRLAKRAATAIEYFILSLSE